MLQPQVFTLILKDPPFARANGYLQDTERDNLVFGLSKDHERNFFRYCHEEIKNNIFLFARNIKTKFSNKSRVFADDSELFHIFLNHIHSPQRTSSPCTVQNITLNFQKYLRSLKLFILDFPRSYN